MTEKNTQKDRGRERERGEGEGVETESEQRREKRFPRVVEAKDLFTVPRKKKKKRKKERGEKKDRRRRWIKKGRSRFTVDEGACRCSVIRSDKIYRPTGVS